jgi:hypothetical protein
MRVPDTRPSWFGALHGDRFRGFGEWLIARAVPRRHLLLSRDAAASGDKAVIYTDGVLETKSPSDQEFGADLFKDFVESNRNLNADRFADLLLDELSIPRTSECSRQRFPAQIGDYK